MTPTDNLGNGGEATLNALPYNKTDAYFLCHPRALIQWLMEAEADIHPWIHTELNSGT